MRVSVVTPTLNRAGMIGEAIRSVVEQDYPPCEHIVMDGGSSDGTQDILSGFDHLSVFSEPDAGLYDAINKGVARATGDIICLVNSDDRLLPGALGAAVAVLQSDESADAACGNVLVGPVSGPSASDIEIGTAAMRGLRAGDVISGLILTNGRFYRRRVFDRLGGFDQAYPTLADRAFLARFYLSGMRTVDIGRPVYRYGLHDASLTLHGGRMGFGQLDEAIALSCAEFTGAASAADRAFYARWYAWAAGYAAARAVSVGQFGRAGKIAAAASCRTPLWPVRFVRQAAWHVATRGERPR